MVLIVFTSSVISVVLSIVGRLRGEVLHLWSPLRLFKPGSLALGGGMLLP